MAKTIVIPILFLWHLCVLSAGVAVLECLAVGIICEKVDELLRHCLFAGVTGSVAYCIRGIYLHICVHQDWHNRWAVWHFGRPPVSMICGGVCYFFLKAGLLLLHDEKTETDFSPYIYYVLAFMAGYNVDNFTRKLEEISKAVMGVVESRASKDSEKEQKDRDLTKKGD